MPSKQQDVVQTPISPVLFMTVDGEPMSFFLRPGPIKCKLQPLITAGGGMLCNVQQPGAILLIDPEERRSVPESTAHWYVSIQYIYDCIEKEEQLHLEDYRLNPSAVQRNSARLNSSKERSPGLSRGRIDYTPEDDAAILNYVSKRKTETGGNRLWQEMERQRVTSHSWQSMKYRYRVRLAKKQSEVVAVETTEEDIEAAEEKTEVEGNQKPSCEEAVVPPQTHAEEEDLTQIDPQSTPKNVDAQTSVALQEEEKRVTQQTDAQPAENTQAESVEAHSLQMEGPLANSETDTQLTAADREEPQTTASPQKQRLPEESPPAPAEATPRTPSSRKSKEMQKESPKPEQPQRRITTRRQLELETLSGPEPYGKKLRSSSSPAEQPTSSFQSLNKTKSAVKSALQKDATTCQPPSKKARGRSAAAVAESQEEESGRDSVSETAQADEPISVPQRAEKRKEKRKLGILELATREFEDEDESEEEAPPDPQNPAETAATSTAEPLPPPSDTAADPASPQSDPEPGSRRQEAVPEAQASGSNCVPEESLPEPAAAEPAVSEALDATSKAHLFIFDTETQEEDSQSVVGDDPEAPSSRQTAQNKDAALSLTQAQLEEDMERIRELMSQTDQDLVSVTKALLKTSGDFSAALELLLNPSSGCGPFWNRCDDSLLPSADPVVRQQLQEKYGEGDVAKRIMFLEVDG